jgi:hypothetical protein
MPQREKGLVGLAARVLAIRDNVTKTMKGEYQDFRRYAM